MTRRRLTLVASAIAGAGVAYGLYRFGASYRPDDPIAGLGDFVERVRTGAAQRESQLRDALGYEANENLPAAPGDGRGRRAEAPAAGARLTPEQARELLRDPAGPTPERAREDD